MATQYAEVQFFFGQLQSENYLGTAHKNLGITKGITSTLTSFAPILVAKMQSKSTRCIKGKLLGIKNKPKHLISNILISGHQGASNLFKGSESRFRGIYRGNRA